MKIYLYGSPELLKKVETDNNNNYGNHRFVKCRKCLFEYSSFFKNCPKCDAKNFSITKTYFVIILLIVVTVIGIIFAFPQNIPKENMAANLNPPTENKVINKAIPSKPTESSFDINTYKKECKKMTFRQISRNPNSLKGVKVFLTGEVIQVQEEKLKTIIRVNITKSDYGYEDTVLLEYQKKNENEDRILEGDIINMWGEIIGLHTYTSVQKQEITLPYIKLVDFNILNK